MRKPADDEKNVCPNGIYWTNTSEGEYEAPGEYAGAAGVSLKEGLMFNYLKSYTQRILPVRKLTLDIVELAASFGRDDCPAGSVCYKDLNQDGDMDGEDLAEIANII